jgi:7-cyano-7-deazaguanine reductase
MPRSGKVPGGSLPVLSPQTVRPSVLETFAYEAAGRDQTIEIETDEFTTVCPWSGLPDFGTVRIRYVPRRRLVELRSLKFYLTAYRNVGIYQEHACARMLRDLATAARPKWMTITLDYRVRGGIHTTCRMTFGRAPKEG